MPNLYFLAPTSTDAASHGAQLWDTLVDLAVSWVNASRIDDVDAAAREQEYRFFALYYVAQASDDAGVSIGRKAIIRAIYAEHGGPDTLLVRTMIDAAITRETTATGR